MKYNNKPSRIASYICDGCLGELSTSGKTTLHGTLVILPTSSPFMKFAILPKEFQSEKYKQLCLGKIKFVNFF